MDMTLSPEISFEFFPPKTDNGLENLVAKAKRLADYQPRYVSVTFGAGGSTQETTPKTVARLLQLGLNVAPHISCVSSSWSDLLPLLQEYFNQGVNRLVVLRGDRPSGMGTETGDLRYAADLVTKIKAEFNNHFHLSVGAYPETHPEAEHAQGDFFHFQQKVQAGANGAITQYFFNADSYFRLLRRAKNHNMSTPIIPGIMPIDNFTSLRRFSQRCGAEIPRWLLKEMLSYENNPVAAADFATEFVTDLCDRLLAGGAPGLHFYTLNKVEQSAAIIDALRQRGYQFSTALDTATA
jgi:methylenetetrahydrofolate reductase (NADPH)